MVKTPLSFRGKSLAGPGLHHLQQRPHHVHLPDIGPVEFEPLPSGGGEFHGMGLAVGVTEMGLVNFLAAGLAFFVGELELGPVRIMVRARRPLRARREPTPNLISYQV